MHIIYHSHSYWLGSRMRALGSSVLLALVVLMVAGCAGGSSSAALFHWSYPNKGQLGTWVLNNGSLQYDGSSDQSILAPYTLPHGGNFAVQARMRATGPAGSATTLTGFGLLVRRTAGDLHTSIASGSFFSSESEDNGPQLYWNGQTAGGAAFDPKSAWHLYRLEVRGNLYGLIIDGKPMVTYTIGDYPNPTRAGIFSRYSPVEVKDFQVVNLAPATAGVATNVTPRTANLTVGDLPRSGFYLPTLAHWYTNLETARERGLSLSSLQAQGRLIAYGVDFSARSRDVADVYSSVAAYKTAGNSLSDLQQRLRVLRQGLSKQNVSFVNLGNQLGSIRPGDHRDGLRFDISAAGTTVTEVVVEFTRGRYTCLLRVRFDKSTAPDNAKNVALVVRLAHIVDRRLH